VEKKIKEVKKEESLSSLSAVLSVSVANDRKIIGSYLSLILFLSLLFSFIF
jgi:hypothetical protein